MKSEIEKAILEENLREVERLLVENPPIVDTVSEDGLPMSFVAAGTGNLDVVKYIVEYSRASMNVTALWDCLRQSRVGPLSGGAGGDVPCIGGL